MQHKGNTPRFAGWVTHVYNPWLSETRVLGSAGGRVHGAEDHARTSARDQVIRWHAAAEDAKAKKTRVFAGPWCRVLTDDVDRAERSDFWELVQATPAIDWLLLFDGGTEKSVKLPANWGDGFSNCWIGIKLTGPGSASDQLDALRSIPALHRFAIASPLYRDLGDLNLHGLDWFIAQLATGLDAGSESVVGLKLQCMAFGVPFWLEEPNRSAEKAAGWDRLAFREAPP